MVKLCDVEHEINNKNPNVNIFIYLMCYNEELLIENSIKHYYNKFPNAIITIMDNYSTDNSVKIAREYKCNIYKWKPDENNTYINQLAYLELKNYIWKGKKTWVIICDMDELLEINEQILKEEEKEGTTILKVDGFQIVSTSKCKRLSDLKLSELNRGYYDNVFSKNICFNGKYINSINYSPGAHKCKPVGIVKFSKKHYILKHLNFLGAPYYYNKIDIRFRRKNIEQSLKNNWSRHYTDNKKRVRSKYRTAVSKAKQTIELLDSKI